MLCNKYLQSSLRFLNLWNDSIQISQCQRGGGCLELPNSLDYIYFNAFGIHCCGMLLDKPYNKTQITQKEKAIRKNSNAWKMHVHKEIHTSSEFCNQHSNDLKFCTVAWTKQNLEQLSLRDLRLYCIFPLKMGLTDGSTLCQMLYNSFKVHSHFSLFGLLFNP